MWDMRHTVYTAIDYGYNYIDFLTRDQQPWLEKLYNDDSTKSTKRLSEKFFFFFFENLELSAKSQSLNYHSGTALIYTTYVNITYNTFLYPIYVHQMIPLYNQWILLFQYGGSNRYKIYSPKMWKAYCKYWSIKKLFHHFQVIQTSNGVLFNEWNT